MISRRGLVESIEENYASLFQKQKQKTKPTHTLLEDCSMFQNRV